METVTIVNNTLRDRFATTRGEKAIQEGTMEYYRMQLKAAKNSLPLYYFGIWRLLVLSPETKNMSFAGNPTDNRYTDVTFSYPDHKNVYTLPPEARRKPGMDLPPVAKLDIQNTTHILLSFR